MVSVTLVSVETGCNSNDALVTVSASGGTPNYTGTGTFGELTAGTTTFTVTDANGCQRSTNIDIPYTDTDNDGTPNCSDGCPSDPSKIASGVCGCGNPEPGTACDDGNAGTSNDVISANCICAGTTGGVRLAMHVFLEGPFNSGTNVMSDAVRVAGLIPTTEPYTGLGFTQVGGGGETTTAAVLAVTGNNAIVDWVIIQLRSSSNSSTIVRTRCALDRKSVV